jgi:hypothetical protein
MKRDKFSRNAVASSRGSYVRKSHFLLIQEQLKARGFDEDLKDIIEASITIKVKKCYAKCLGKMVIISEEDAKRIERTNPELIIRL